MAYKTNELPALLRIGAWNFDPAHGTIVTDFQAGHGYTTSGADASSNVNDTSQFVMGSQCATVVSAGTGASAILQNTSAISPTDTTNLQAVVIMKCDDTTHLNSLKFSMGDAGAFTNEYHVQYNAQANMASGAWIVVTLCLGDANSQGSPTRTGISAIRVYHKDDNTGNKVTVHYQGIWFMPNAATQPGAPFPSGVASVCFDDGFATQWVTAKPYLDTSGLRASAYIIKDQLGTSGRMTLAQVQSLQDQSGWETCAHAYTDADHSATDTALTAEQLIWDLSAQKEWLLVNGLNGQGFAYPKGAANPAVVSEVRQFHRYARGTQGMTETYPAGDPYRLKGFSSISEFSGGTAPSSISQAGGAIDRAVTNGAWLLLTFHNIIPAVTSVTMSGNIATMVFAAAIPTTSTWQATSTITLAGFTPSGLNGSHTIASVVNSTTITVNIGSNPGNSTIQGTAVTATTDCSYPGYTAIVDKLGSSGIRVLPVAEAFTGGQQSAGAPSFPLSVPNGGTGDASLTAYALLAGGTTSSGAVQQVGGLGSAGQVLTSAGAGALPAFAAANYGGLFGDGSDGAVTFDGTTTILGLVPSVSVYTMTRDIMCTSITINNGVTVKTGGYRIFCAGAVTNAGTISNNGNNASVASAGGSTSNGSTSRGASGAGGVTGVGVAGSNPTACPGQGAGGAGGAGTSGSGGSAGTVSAMDPHGLRLPQVAATGTLVNLGSVSPLAGGSGGGSGSGDASIAGGGGGGGGGVIVIAAQSVNNGSGTISAQGGNGGTPSSGNCGGGGPGGGGLILVYTLTAWTAGTTSVTAGTPGTHTGTGVNGSAGTSGTLLNVVVA